MSQQASFESLIASYVDAKSHLVSAKRKQAAATRDFLQMRSSMREQLRKLNVEKYDAKARLDQIRSSGYRHKTSQRPILATIRRLDKQIDRVIKKLEKSQQALDKCNQDYRRAGRLLRDLRETVKRRAVELGQLDPMYTDSKHTHVRIKRGRVDLYFGGVGRPSGPGHAHYVFQRDGRLVFRRDPAPKLREGERLAAEDRRRLSQCVT